MSSEKLSSILEKITDNFRERLQRKTGWGRNEVQLELQKAISQALADFIDPPEQASA